MSVEQGLPAPGPGAAPPPPLSVVVPTLDEELTLGRLLADVRQLPLAHEVIVSDGGSVDGTVAVAAEWGARFLSGTPGRGAQLAVGAAAAHGAWLLVLHADVRLDVAARQAVVNTIQRGERAAYAFRLRIDGARPSYRLLEWGANLRSRFARLPYGDQGLLVPRALYDAAGGYPDAPVMEDVLLVRRLARLAPVRLLHAAVSVSPRRWEHDGPILRTVRNWRLMMEFYAGVSPHRLAERYRPHALRRATRAATPQRSLPRS